MMMMMMSKLCQNELASWAEWQSESNDSELQTEGVLTLEAFADNASAIRGTDSKEFIGWSINHS